MLTEDAFEPTLLSAIRKYWPVVVVTTFACLILALLIHATIADNWVAESSMLVENPESSQLFDQQTAASPQRYAADQVAIMSSSEIALRASQIANRQPRVDSPVSLEDVMAAAEIDSNLDSGLIEITVTHEDPELAVAIANALIDAYRENREQEAARGFESALAEFDESIADVDAELEAIESDISSLRSSGAQGDLDARMQTAIDQLVSLLAQPEQVPPEQIENVVQQLESIQLIRAVQGEDPALASRIEARGQALDRRSQLALRRDQLKVDAALTSTGIALISPARSAEEAVGTSRASAMGLLAGLLLGSALAFALANRSQRFTHRTEPELVLNAPLLAEVPDFSSEDLSTDLPIRDAPRSAAAESFRFAAAALHSRPSAGSSALFERQQADSQTVAVASSLLGQGKSVVTANLGIAAATRGRNVLLIDCDFGDPSLSTMLNASPSHPGITDVVENSVSLNDAVQRVDMGDGMSVNLLTRGTQSVTAPAFFRTPDTEALFNSIGDRYDLVLVDVPPILQVAYAGSVVRLCDRTLVVVPHRSEVSSLAEALDRISMTNSEILGYIYNRSPLRREMTSREGSMRDPLGLGDGRSRLSPLPYEPGRRPGF